MFGKLASSLKSKAQEEITKQVGSQVQQFSSGQKSLDDIPPWAKEAFSKVIGVKPAPAGAERGQQAEHAQQQTEAGFLQGSGRKKALFIGINYFGSKGELRGCINDVKAISQWVTTNYSFEPDHVHFLTDDQQDPNKKPTKKNILQQLSWLVDGAKAGDSLFLHYSGHGGTAVDTDGDEQDGHDETIIPLDYETAGQITDDELHSVLCAKVPAGAQLTAIFDSCHSGSVLDLPFTYTVNGQLEVVEIDNRAAGAKKLFNAAMNWQQGKRNAVASDVMEGLGMLFSKKASVSATDEQKQEVVRKRTTAGTVIQFSGCRDEQTSADANIENRFTGALSWALMQVLSQNKQPSFTTLLKEVRQLLHGKYSQVPQMSSGFQMDMSRPFSL